MTLWNGFLPGLQTHIEFPVPMERLLQSAELGVWLARQAAMEEAAETMLRNKSDAEAAALVPIVTIADPDRMRLFEPGDHVECRNEDDGDLSPKEYRRILDEMAALALEREVHLWGGVGSNTDEDSLKWGNEVRDCGGGWPKGMAGLSWHMYGPYPHNGFTRREGKHPAWAELEWLMALAADKPVLITEFGEANTTGFSEEQQAESIAGLWQCFLEFHQFDPKLKGACLFQIHDGKNPNNREDRYGIYRCDAQGNIGDLKPVAFTFPKGRL